jgi:hypothetical protein
MVIVSLLLRYILGSKPLRIRLIPFQVITVLLLVLELGKQINSSIGSYDLYSIPLHFCSMALFTMPVMSFYNGKHAQIVRAVTASVCGSIFLLTAIYPELIYSGACVDSYFTDFGSFHTVTFHNLVMFAFLLIPALNLHEEPGRHDVRASALFILGYSAVAAPLAQILKVNFNNFYSCNVGPLEQVRISLQAVLGYGLTQVLYVLIVVMLDVLFTIMCYWFYRLLRLVSVGRKTSAVS